MGDVKPAAWDPVVAVVAVGRAQFALCGFARTDPSGWQTRRWYVRLHVPGARAVVSGVHESLEQAKRTFEAWVAAAWLVASALPEANEGAEVF